ncbi:MAG: hypothetical protein LBU62_06860, partial [Bacteroidales bacterium]|nr:hypothetical protein [Bacteroidales bacterium]
KPIIYALGIIVLVSCQPNTQGKKIQEKVFQWQGTEMTVPPLTAINWNGLDSCNLYDRYDYKMVYHINGDCHACVDHLPKIDSLYQTVKTSNTTLLIYVFSGDYAHFENLVERINIKIPFIYDKQNLFYSQNKLSIDPLYHCFLLDKDNKVLLVGSPISNPKMWALYKQRMTQTQ